MNNDNRVLGRRGARELTPRETEHVTGGIQTNTVCTFEPGSPKPDGDASIGEC
jgi:hypothetical protein